MRSMPFPGHLLLKIFGYHSYEAYAPVTAALHSFAHVSHSCTINEPLVESRAMHGSHIFDSPYCEHAKVQDSDDPFQPEFLVKQYIDKRHIDAACIFDLKHEVTPPKEYLAAGPRGGNQVRLIPRDSLIVSKGCHK